MDSEFERVAKDRLGLDPGEPVFAEYGDELRREGRASDALGVLLRGLTANPNCDRGRLVLARLFYDQELVWFAVRELEYLISRNPSNRSMQKLLQSYSSKVVQPDSGKATQNSTLAEAEMDMDLLESIDE